MLVALRAENLDASTQGAPYSGLFSKLAFAFSEFMIDLRGMTGLYLDC